MKNSKGVGYAYLVYNLGNQIFDSVWEDMGMAKRRAEYLNTKAREDGVSAYFDVQTVSLNRGPRVKSMSVYLGWCSDDEEEDDGK